MCVHALKTDFKLVYGHLIDQYTVDASPIIGRQMW